MTAMKTPGLEQVHGRGMADHMGRDGLGAQAGAGRGGDADDLLEEIHDPMP